MEEARLNLLNEVDIGLCAKISSKAWREARSAQAKLKNVPIDRETGEPAMYRLDVRTKQKILLDFLLNVSQTPEVQSKIVEWAYANTGDFLKVMASQMPKEISVSGSIVHGIIAVPNREKNIGAWLERQQEMKEDAVPFVLDDVNWDTTPKEVSPDVD